jgi:branched-chain amino acid aminotransferase
MSHGLHYGSTVFEGIRAYATPRGPAIFRLPEHVARLIHSASVAKMRLPYDREEIIAAVLKTIVKNNLTSGYIRPLLFYSYGNLGLVPKASPVELVIGAWEWTAYLGEKAENGVSAYILPWKRVHPSQLDMTAKLGGIYMQSTISGLEAREHGHDEAIFLNLEGRVAEGPGENIFIVKDGVLKTNDRSESVLEGITRTSILEIARGLGFRTAIGPIPKKDLLGAEEVFFTGTAVEVVPVVKITDASDPKKPKKTCRVAKGKPGPATRALRSAYLDIVHGRAPEYEKWLTFVSP